MQTKNHNYSKLTLHTDGGSRGNPGDAGIGFQVVGYASGAENILEKCGDYIGIKTNNQAEYQALILGLDWIISSSMNDIPLEIFMDSLLVVNQIKGLYKIKNPNISSLAKTALNLLEKFTNYSITHVKRDKNFSADELVNLAIDKKGRVEA